MDKNTLNQQNKLLNLPINKFIYALQKCGNALCKELKEIQ